MVKTFQSSFPPFPNLQKKQKNSRVLEHYSVNQHLGVSPNLTFLHYLSSFLCENFVKNMEKGYFNQRLECKALKHWSKYTIVICIISKHLTNVPFFTILLDDRKLRLNFL